MSKLKISFPDALPVSRRRQDIRDALEKHQVVIVCGDTGSGKTTQLPKIALEMGRGREGRRIGCTQPRRIAATSVAKRVAEELQVTLGQEVGYQIRFDDRTSRELTAVKFMTDGILLAETQNDPDLRQYDTLIIDEAHERSLNIDFILGYLHRTLKRRSDLKIIISSATLDAGSFSEFFSGAPVLEVEGRTFPVEDRFQEPLHDRERVAEQVWRAVEDLEADDFLGDTLVFLPGEREIRDTADLLEGRKSSHMMVLPLFSRQAGKEQQAVFNPIKGKRRIILATNVAETSLTIPGIRFVIDSGLARVSRHETGGGIQRLQIEPVSQASARQRRGRCGRVSDGVCVRLYSEEDFLERPEFTDPEILRTNLAGVVLQMEHLRLGDPLKFPFVDPPQVKRVAQAYRVLEEIGAVEKHKGHYELTSTGRTLARLPVDPRVGRILVGAKDEGCLQEALIIASALTVQDPKERPKEKQEAADQAHAKFRDKRSDFTSWLHLWFAIQEERGKSSNTLRRFCQKNFINFRRVQEWMNMHRELRDSLKSMKWKLPGPDQKITDPEDTYSEPLHRAILAAIPSQIGMHQGKKQGYKGTRNSTFFLFPGSAVFGASPAWVMAFDMVETARLYARNVAAFDPGCFEKVAPHLCRYRYSNPHWVAEQGAVYGEERVTGCGLPVIEKRKVHYGRIDHKLARSVFILEALVNGKTRAPMPALKRNHETLLAAERLEHKLRRLGGLAHPEAVIEFYESRVPETLCTQKEFEKWVSSQEEGAIDFSLEECLVPQVEPIVVENYPDSIYSPDGETEFLLRYLHNPADPGDGITMIVPLVELPHLPDWFGDWLVPGWLPEKMSVLIRCLQKDIRTMLPANRDVVQGFVEAWEGFEPNSGLVEALIDWLEDEYGIEISSGSFDLDRVPVHLGINFAVIDDKEKLIRTGRDLAALKSELAGEVKERFSSVAGKGRNRQFEKAEVKQWDFGDLPEWVELDRHTKGYPRLRDTGREYPGMKLWSCQVCAGRHQRLGVARLFRASHRETMERLKPVLFATGKVGAKSNAASRPEPKTKAKIKSDGFGSLAAAFGESAAPMKIASVAKARSQPKSATAGGGLSAENKWLLSQIGMEPDRNEDDLFSRIVTEVMGAPITASEWKIASCQKESALFEKGAEMAGQLRRLLEVVERVSRLLGNREVGFEDSFLDASNHFEQLLSPGWILTADFPKTLRYFEGLEMRLTRMLGAPPVKDLQKLERYEDASFEIWNAHDGCECGQCCRAMQMEAIYLEDNDLRLKIFAPEIRARMK